MDRRKRDGWIVIVLGLAALGLAFWLYPSEAGLGRGRGLQLIVAGCLVLVGGGIWLLWTPPRRIL